MTPESRKIQKLVASHFGLSRAELLSHSRSPKISRPRQIAMALCRMLTSMSYPDIGLAFGGFDHSTVINAYKRVQQRLEDNDPTTVQAVLHVREQIAEHGILPLVPHGDRFVDECVAAGIRADAPRKFTVLRKQCAECPWSRESRPGLFSPTRFKVMASTCEEWGPLFACHKSVAGRDLPCAGWVEYQRLHGNNVRLRLAIAQSEDFAPPELRGEQFESFEEMASAHAEAWNNWKGSR
ncbi:MAG: hypothetical protein K0U16_07715 [Gammaproteobacteria bacterium]|nr:hypothetical protein [Gammaproteobacteria bacterium]